jgi:predicted Zn-dependent peptidase
MGIWLNVGSRDEQESESGLTHFIEHMLFKGTEKRSAQDIAKQLDAVGGMSNAFTSKVDILSDIFLHSVFEDREVQREREVILQEINMVEDTPDEYVHVLFNQTFGNMHTVQSFTREMILPYLSRGYHPDRIVISAAGRVDHQEFLELVEPTFGKVKRHSHDLNRIPPNTASSVDLFPRDLEQIHLCLGTRGTSVVEMERYCCSILNVSRGAGAARAGIFYLLLPLLTH